MAEIEVKEESQKPLLFNKTLSYSLSFETSARREAEKLPVDCILLMARTQWNWFVPFRRLPTLALETISGSHLLEFITTLFQLPFQSPGALGLISLPLNNCFVD